MDDLKSRIGKWFKPDLDRQSGGYISTVNPSDRIIGSRGFGGPGVSGQIYAVEIDREVYIFAGVKEQIKTQDGKSRKSPKGRQGYYGYCWKDVHFQRNFEELLSSQKYLATDMTDDSKHQKAVDIAIEFYTIQGLLNMKVPPIREIEFTKLGPAFGGDPRNPTEIIEVNQDVD